MILWMDVVQACVDFCIVFADFANKFLAKERDEMVVRVFR